jgi:hypothetical protein
MLYEAFFPPKMASSSVPANTVYPAPAWVYEPITDALVHRVIRKMKPFKATKDGTNPNCVFVYNAHLLVPFYGAIYRSCDALGYYPPGWAHIDSLALRKPGKPDYSAPGAHRPICLTDGDARLYHGCVTVQIADGAELAGILPNNQFGGRPGRTTTDAIHMVLKIVKDAWRDGKVASILCMDVKSAFPSVDLDRLYHDMRMLGVPKQYTDFLPPFRRPQGMHPIRRPQVGTVRRRRRPRSRRPSLHYCTLPIQRRTRESREREEG